MFGKVLRPFTNFLFPCVPLFLVARFVTINGSFQTIGLVLNQSYFICPSCDTPHCLFGSPDAAMGLGVELLGELPLTPGVSTGGDAGLPYALLSGRSETDGVAGTQWREAMTDIAERVWEALHSDAGPGTTMVPR